MNSNDFMVVICILCNSFESQSTNTCIWVVSKLIGIHIYTVHKC